MQTDLHQHLWTRPLLDALADRHTYPFVERTAEGLTVLHCAGEAPWVVDSAAQEAAGRQRQMVRDGSNGPWWRSRVQSVSRRWRRLKPRS